MATITTINKLASAANDISYLFNNGGLADQELARVYDRLYKAALALSLDRQLFTGITDTQKIGGAIRDIARSSAVQASHPEKDTEKLEQFVDELLDMDIEDPERVSTVADGLAKFLATESRKRARRLWPSRVAPKAAIVPVQGLSGLPSSAISSFGWTR